MPSAETVLAESFRWVNRTNALAWAASNVRDPGAPVPANLAPELLAASRDLARQGLHESAVRAYLLGQNALWQRWMSIAFELTAARIEALVHKARESPTPQGTDRLGRM